MSTAIEEWTAAELPDALEQIAGGDRPLVIRGLCRHWPLVKRARESDTAFAQALASLDNGTAVDALLLPAQEQGVIGYSADLQRFNFDHFRVSVSQVLRRLAQYSRQDDPPGLALQSALISACLPELPAQLGLSWLDPSIQPRLWIGNRVTTPAHFDEFHNVACVVAGRRRFTVFPPEQVRNLYPGPLDFAPTGAAISVARLDRPGDPRFPRLRDALAASFTAELAAGDAIYMPPMWWHHVASLEPLNALVNYWWKPALAPGVAQQTVIGCLYDCILSFKSLPRAEREAWRAMLDYYVFDAADPAAHLPPSRRGMLGLLTPKLAASLRETVRKYL